MGLSLKKIRSGVRDIFDANTEADQQRRIQAGQAANYADQQRAKGVDSRSIANNPAQRLVTVGTSVARPVVKSVQTAVPTVAKGFRGAYDLVDIGRESIFGTDESYQRKAAESLARIENTAGYSEKGGFLGAGTALQSTNDLNDPKKFIGSMLETGANLASVVPTGAAVKAGTQVTGKELMKQTAKYANASGLLNVASEGGRQLNENGKVDPTSLAVAYGTGVALPVVGAAVGRGAKVVASNAKPLNQAGALNPKAPQVGKTTPNNQRTIDSYSTPKPVTEYKVGEKVSNATAQGGMVDGTIVKVPDFSKDLRIKGNNFVIKLDDGTTVKTDGAGFDTPIAQVGKTVDADALSKQATNSFLNKPEAKFNKPNRFKGEGYSYAEALTGKTKTGKDLDGRIVIGKNEAGQPVLKDGTHLLEAYREKNIPIPARKVRYEDGLGPKQGSKTNVAQYVSVDEKHIDQIVKDLQSSPTVATSKKDVSRLNRAWQTVSGVISQYGDVGATIAQKLAAHRNASEIGQQRFWSSIPSVQNLKKDEFPLFAQALDELSRGKAPQTTPRIRQAIAEWNAAIPSIREQAVKAGIDTGDLGPNYFPRIYKDIHKDTVYNKLIDNIIANDKAKGITTSRAEAIKRAEFIKQDGARTFGNLDKSREADAPGYDMSHEAVVAYVNRAFDRISKAEQFGPNNELLDEAKAQLIEQGYRADPDSVFARYLDIALGNTDKTTGAHRASSVVRKFNAVTSLSAAGISNMTQSTNTATIGGVGRTVKAITQNAGGKLWGAEARQAAVDAGVLLDHSIADITNQQLGTSGKITRNIASPFFQKIEKFNRQVSAMVGADYGNALAKSGKHDVLREKFGVTGKIGDELTDAQKVQVARKMVEISQFKVDPMDIPGWADSPLGKLAIQFRTFGYKQTGFVWNQVLREATKGNFVPLARFVAVGAPAGLAAQEIRSVIQAKKDGGEEDTSPKSQQILGKIGEGLSAVGGFGLPGTTAIAAKRGLDYRDVTSTAISTIGGPTAGLISETISNLSKAEKGNTRPLKKQVVRKVPAVGPTASNLLFPKADTPTAPKDGEKATPEYLEEQSKKEIEALKARKTTDGYSLQKLSNGKYAYTLDGDTTVHTASTLKKANAAIAKDAFADSDQNIKVVGETVYRKGADGEVTATTKTKYEYQLGQQELEKYKRADNMTGWMTAANKQLDSIEKQLQDPNIDPLDAISLQNDAEALIEKMQKYGGQGGFKKGSGGSGADSNPYRFAVSLKAGSSGATPKVKTAPVAKVGIATKSAATAKPKVTIKKSMV